VRELLTERREGVSLLGSMYMAAVQDASQRLYRRVPVVEEYAALRYCWTLRWLPPAHLICT
jgi:hypothetical protein